MHRPACLRRQLAGRPSTNESFGRASGRVSNPETRHLRAGSFPGPGDGVQLVRVPDADGLDRDARVERARLEGDQAGSIRARALREYEDLGPVQVGGRPVYDLLDGVMPGVGVVAPHVNRLGEIDELWKNGIGDRVRLFGGPDPVQ